jgi:hypothetical protein
MTQDWRPVKGVDVQVVGEAAGLGAGAGAVALTVAGAPAGADPAALAGAGALALAHTILVERLVAGVLRLARRAPDIRQLAPRPL